MRPIADFSIATEEARDRRMTPKLFWKKITINLEFHVQQKENFKKEGIIKIFSDNKNRELPLLGLL